MMKMIPFRAIKEIKIKMDLRDSNPLKSSENEIKRVISLIQIKELKN